MSTKKDTTEKVLEYNKGYKKFNLKDEREKEWGRQSLKRGTGNGEWGTGNEVNNFPQNFA